MKKLLKQKALIMSILIIAMPAIMEMALNTALMVADTMMVGKMIGEDALSAVGNVNSIFFLLIFVFSSFNTGAIALISRSYGEKNMDRVNKVASINVRLNLIIGIGISLLAFVFRNGFLAPFDITDAVRESAIQYFTIIIVGMVFQFGSFAFASISRGVEDTKTPMIITLIVNVINIGLNYLLIKGVGIFPELGIAGAALATTIARIVAFVIYAVIFVSGKHKIRIKVFKMKWDRMLTSQLWKISYPGALEQFLLQFSFFVVGIIIATLDTDSEALFRILINIESTSFMPAVGVSIATATLVGKAIGEKDTEKGLHTGYIACLLGIIWSIFAGVLFVLFPGPIVYGFTDKPEMIKGAVYIMIFMAINQPFLNFSIIMSGALRGAGDTGSVMKITSLRLWTTFVPLSALFIMYLNTGVAGVWFAEILSFIVFSYVLFQRFHGQAWAKVSINETVSYEPS